MRNNIFLKLFVFLICFSCKSQKSQLNSDTEEIINVLLDDYESVYLIKETYFNDSSFHPINVLNPYYRAYAYGIMIKSPAEKENNIAYNVFLKEIDGLISKIELDEMNQKYKSWTINEWEESDLKNSKVKLILLQESKKIKDSIPTVIFSEPLFTKDQKKAIIHVAYLKNKTGSSGILIMVKENGKWIKKGGIADGTIG